MKLLFDENLSRKLIRALAALFPGSAHVVDVGLMTADDEEIWDFAVANGMVIVTKDTDFQHRSAMYGHPPKVVLLDVGNGPTKAIAGLLTARHADLLVFETDPMTGILVIS